METTLYIPPLGLAGRFDAPADFAAAVIFAHGTSSGRMSPRNVRVAARLREAGFATLLIDLLTEGEKADPANQFDVHRQSERLLLAVRHLRATTAVERKPIGFFGAGSGAASALIAAGRAAEHDGVGAVVCRGGRPDLAEEWLNAVAAPTLLVVGGKDAPALDLNNDAFTRLHCTKALEVVPGAGRLFEETGKLDQVADSARSWFTTHLLKAANG
ncbi:dienelactone hydrolase family protein [Azospirillum brasilense]|uniref:dienelactone hydrolase family protein n=1 Tax=Azospirillum brasilense TaxID=192 RepID=UPI001ED9CF28|nr:dienelactone hydrolase family protein [Azospirillum brasilense]UKJ72866.1 dienelactone hydrolase family protein [Azospirillum brasilense]